MDLDLRRRFYAEEIEAVARLRSAAVVDALASVPRERFLRPGPWTVLADIDINGSPRKVMMWGNRNGVFYVLDRTTGQFLSGTSFVKTNWFTAFDEKGRPTRA